jgi:hypothetical protein
MRYFLILLQLPSQDSQLFWQFIVLTFRHLLALCLITIVLIVGYFIFLGLTDRGYYPDPATGALVHNDMHGFGLFLFVFGPLFCLAVLLFVVTYLIQTVRLIRRGRGRGLRG